MKSPRKLSKKQKGWKIEKDKKIGGLVQEDQQPNKRSSGLEKTKGQKSQWMTQESFPEVKHIVPDGRVSLRAQSDRWKRGQPQDGSPWCLRHWGQKGFFKLSERTKQVMQRTESDFMLLNGNPGGVRREARRQRGKAFNTQKKNDFHPWVWCPDNLAIKK